MNVHFIERFSFLVINLVCYGCCLFYSWNKNVILIDLTVKYWRPSIKVDANSFILRLRVPWPLTIIGGPAWWWCNAVGVCTLWTFHTLRLGNNHRDILETVITWLWPLSARPGSPSGVSSSTWRSTPSPWRVLRLRRHQAVAASRNVLCDCVRILGVLPFRRYQRDLPWH